MNWGDVGQWLKRNGAGLVGLAGAVATGNVPAGVAAVASMVSEATGETDPAKALARLQADPETLVRLEEIAKRDEADIRAHHREMLRLELEDTQHEHHETQETIRGGDRAEDPFVRRTRPAQSWVSLFAAIAYTFGTPAPDIYILGLLLTLPWAYAGLRQIGKGVDAVAGMRRAK